jgi:aminopeptidase N
MRGLVLLPFLFACALAPHAQPGWMAPQEHIGCSHKTQQWRAIQTDAPTDYDMLYVNAHWVPHPERNELTGTVTHTVRALRPGLDSFHTELATTMQVLEVRFRGQPAAWKHVAPYHLGIALPQPVADGDTFSITIAYTGGPPAGVRSMDTTHLDGVPVIWTLSQPFGSRDWWPVRENLNDKIDSLVIAVTVQDGFTGVANGNPAGEVPGTGTITFLYKHRYPVSPYLVAFAAAPYGKFFDTIQLSTGVLPIRNYYYPKDSAFAVDQTPGLYGIFRYFDSLFAPYPFMDEQYGHAQFAWPGGMEHQTISFMYNYNYDLMVHELAHQWFGDWVTCASWRDIWLNEGFATYLTGLAYERESPGLYWPIWKQQLVERVTAEPDGAVLVDDTLNVSRIFNSRLTYRKGAGVLHMLRWVMGDGPFFDGIRQYLQAFADGYATTPQFRQHMETAHGDDLGWFFSQWLEGEGHPNYTLNAWQSGSKLHLTLRQVPSHLSVDFFRMPVPVRVFGSEDDTMLVLDHTHQGQHWEVELPFTLSGIEFDPERWLLATYDVSWSVRQNSDVLRIWPVPASDRVSYSIAAPVGEGAWVEVFSASGQKLMKAVPMRQEGSLDTGALPNGMYLMRYRSGGEEATVRFVISRP